MITIVRFLSSAIARRGKNNDAAHSVFLVLGFAFCTITYWAKAPRSYTIDHQSGPLGLTRRARRRRGTSKSSSALLTSVGAREDEV